MNKFRYKNLMHLAYARRRYIHAIHVYHVHIKRLAWILTHFTIMSQRVERNVGIFFPSGIGYAGAFLMQWVNIYYTVILGWALFYMFASFQSTLPWSHCGNEWNTPNCVDRIKKGSNHGMQINDTIKNVTLLANKTMTNASKPVSASQEYWE